MEDGKQNSEKEITEAPVPTTTLSSFELHIQEIQDMIAAQESWKKALEEGDIDKINAFLDENPNFAKKAFSPNGYKQLHETDFPLEDAVESGRADVVALLISRQADVNAFNPQVSLNYRENPLQRAASKGNVEIINMLLEAKADVNVGRDIRPEWTASQGPLERAAVAGHADAVRRLLEAKALDGNSSNPIYQRTMNEAARWGHASVIMVLKEMWGGKGNAEAFNKFVNSFDEIGATPLLKSIDSNSSYEAIELLLELKADPNNTPATPLYPTTEHYACSVTPLHAAANEMFFRTEDEAVRAITLLLGARANIDPTFPPEFPGAEEYKATPLYMAARAQRPQVVRCLLEAKASTVLFFQHTQQLFATGKMEVIDGCMKAIACLNSAQLAIHRSAELRMKKSDHKEELPSTSPIRIPSIKARFLKTISPIRELDVGKMLSGALIPATKELGSREQHPILDADAVTWERRLDEKFPSAPSAQSFFREKPGKVGVWTLTKGISFPPSKEQFPSAPPPIAFPVEVEQSGETSDLADDMGALTLDDEFQPEHHTFNLHRSLGVVPRTQRVESESEEEIDEESDEENEDSQLASAVLPQHPVISQGSIAAKIMEEVVQTPRAKL